jgi:hypothetical protein
VSSCTLLVELVDVGGEGGEQGGRLLLLGARVAHVCPVTGGRVNLTLYAV